MKRLIMGIVPARGGSSGFPNKNILPINFKPVIAYTIEDALKSKILDKVVVSTDSLKIAKVACKYGSEVVMRPKYISTNTSRVELALRHAIEFYNKKKSYFPEIIVFMQANIPIRSHGLIEKVVNKLINTGADAVVSVSQPRIHPDWLQVIKNNDRLVNYTKPNAYRRQNLSPIYFMDGAAEAIKVKTLMATKNNTNPFGYLGRDIRAVVQPEGSWVEIDTPVDLLFAEAILSTKKK